MLYLFCNWAFAVIILVVQVTAVYVALVDFSGERQSALLETVTYFIEILSPVVDLSLFQWCCCMVWQTYSTSFVNPVLS